MKALIRGIYGYIPFKRELFLLVRSLWKPKHSIYKHLHFVGVFEVPIDNQKKFKIKHYGFQLENELFWSGIKNGWEKESSKLWIKLCANSEVIFDIGANTGIYALIAKTVNPQAKVVAFEPVERVFAKLQENILLNNFDIFPVKSAVSNANGTAIIYDSGGDHVYSVTVNKNLSMPETKVAEVKINTITLNTFIKSHNIKKIDLIKIDVETHEPEVLEGFSEFIQEFKPTLLIEILNDELASKIENLVNCNNYVFYNIDEAGGVRKVAHLSKSDYFNYLICSPEVAKRIGL